MGSNMTTDKLTIEFEPQTLADIFLAIHMCEVEISGLARVIRTGKRFRVFGEGLIFKQTCSSIRTEPDIESLNLWFNDMASSENQEKISKMESYQLWWHSHVWFDVIFSGTDFRTMKNLVSGGDWWLALVANKKNEVCLALVKQKLGFLRYEEAPITLCPEVSPNEFKKIMITREEIIRQAIKTNVEMVSDSIRK